MGLHGSHEARYHAGSSSPEKSSMLPKADKCVGDALVMARDNISACGYTVTELVVGWNSSVIHK
jgi:hypothetical protein